MASAKYQELLERLPQVAKPWKAALYIRLSREDGDKVESNSITSQREILTLKEQLTEKTTSLEKALENLKRTNEEFKNGITEDNDFISHFKKYGKIDTLTRAMVVELIDKIYVHEGGRITISFKFTDAYEKALEYIELKPSSKLHVHLQPEKGRKIARTDDQSVLAM